MYIVIYAYKWYILCTVCVCVGKVFSSSVYLVFSKLLSMSLICIYFGLICAMLGTLLLPQR